jgi:hypothetical protein
MKRAMFIAIAALLVLLVYPSTHPYAKSPNPGVISGPTVVSPYSADDPPVGYTDNDDGDDGDSDDVGWRDKGTRPNGNAPAGGSHAPASMGINLLFKMWWNFTIWIW